MSAPKTPVEVGKGMEQYDIRRGGDPLPREIDPLGMNPIHCFDRGHHRVISNITLANIQNDADGDFIIMRGRRIEMQQVVSVFGFQLPVGFVAVPLQVILQHFTTRYGRNIQKMERKLREYHTQFSVYRRELAAGNILGRPRRPTLKSLNLDVRTEFESFLQPLKSFYFTRLKMAFSNLVHDAEDGQYTVFNNINIIALPDLVGGVRSDQAAQLRWNAANGRFIAVRISDFDTLVTNGPPQFPAPQLPFPANPPAAPIPVAAVAPPAPPTPREIDEQMLELSLMGRSKKWRGLFLYMTPWEAATLVPNPFVSPEYRQAFAVAQNSFQNRHEAFRIKMRNKRRLHAQKWREYAAYRDEMNSASMLDTDRQPVNQNFAGIERPQIEHFTKEWKHFAFGLKEEMKNYRFMPVAPPPAVPPPGFVPMYAAFAPNVQPYTQISNNVLQSAHRMFLI